MYGLWMEIWTISEMLDLLWSEEGGACPRVTHGGCHWMHFIIRNNDIWGLEMELEGLKHTPRGPMVGVIEYILS